MSVPGSAFLIKTKIIKKHRVPAHSKMTLIAGFYIKSIHIMKKIYLFVIAFMALMPFTQSFGAEVVSDNLKAALKELGYEFDGNNVIVSDKVKETSELNLSGKSITDFTGLDVFPNLVSLVLDGSEYETVGNDMFSNIKNSNAGIVKLSMRDCGILNLDLTNADGFKSLAFDGKNKFQSISGFGKDSPVYEYLSLPESSKWNYEEILSYYVKNKGNVDMRVDINGSLEKYTEIRKVPNYKFRAFLKRVHPEMFNEDDMLVMTNDMNIDNTEFTGNTTWHTSEIDPWYFDASGMGDMDGYQFFRNRAIREWWIFNGEFETLDLANDKVLTRLIVGQNRGEDFRDPVSTNQYLKNLYVNGCTNLEYLSFDGQVEEINLSGLKKVEFFNFGHNVKHLDMSEMEGVVMVYSLASDSPDSARGKLRSFVYPPCKSTKLMQLNFNNTEIEEFDYKPLKKKGDLVEGLALCLERCPNLKNLVLKGVRLSHAATFCNGYFEKIDLRGCLVEIEGEWVPAEGIEHFYENNPYLKELNGKPYIQDSDPEFVKTLDIDVSNPRQWTYFNFDENGEIQIMEIAEYQGETQEIVSEEDAVWKEIPDWDFALHLNNIRTNSGFSGIGNGGLYEHDCVDWFLTKQDLASMTFATDEMTKMVINMDEMPPMMVDASMSNVELFQNLGMGNFNPLDKVFVVKCVEDKYAILRFARYNDYAGKSGQLRLKYYLVQKNEDNRNGIESVEETPEIENIYSVNGMCTGRYTKGVNIVKMSDGSVKKIIVK